jgi:hypothetical protein
LNHEPLSLLNQLNLVNPRLPAAQLEDLPVQIARLGGTRGRDFRRPAKRIGPVSPVDHRGSVRGDCMVKQPCRQPPAIGDSLGWPYVFNHVPRSYLACSRTSGPVTLHVFPFASVPLNVVCAVCADDETLHHRVRIVVEAFAAMRKFGFVAEPAAPSNVSTRRVIVTATPPVSRST